MNLVVWFAVVSLAACHGRNLVTRSTAGAPAASGAAKATPREPPVAPHGGSIELGAITDRGDAALTADAFGQIRLWLTLDGTREPIVVRGPSPVHLALGRDDGGLFAAVVNVAGGAELLRFDARGNVRGRAQLAPQPAIEEVVAVGGEVLIRRSDHSIARFDSRGTARGRLVPDPGERVVSLAGRRDCAVAGIARGDEPRATILRWIELGNEGRSEHNELAWGRSLALPVPLLALAISPGGRRVAGIAVDDAARGPIAKIIELEPDLAVAVTLALTPVSPRDRMRRRRSRAQAPTVGFVTDGTVAFAMPGQLVWATETRGRPWVIEPHARPFGAGIAIGDRAAGASGAMLHVSDSRTDDFLGYRFVGAADPSTGDRFRDGHGVILQAEGGPLWIDRQLRAQDATLDPDVNDLALVLDDDHVLVTPLASGPHLKKRIIIRDVTTSTGIEIATLEGITGIHYDPGTRVLAIAASDSVLRYRIAFDPVDATPLRTLADAGPMESFHLTDPALAKGVVAVVAAALPHTHVRIYRLDGDDRGPALAPRQLELIGPLAAVDRAGTIYAAGSGLHVYRDGRATGEKVPGISDSTAINHAGTAFAVGNGDAVTVRAGNGAERWHRAVWRAGPVAWSRDDRTLFVATEGGAALSFDATTGEQLAMRCGWAFGRFSDDVGVATNAPSACGAAPLDL